MEIKAVTQQFWEQGMGGIDYCLEDPTKEGYEGLIILKDGDHLIIPGKFKGYIKKTSANIYGLSWTQKGWTKEEWKSLFYNEHKALYRKNQEVPSIYTTNFLYIT